MSIGYMYLYFILGSFWPIFPAIQTKKLKVPRDSWQTCKYKNTNTQTHKYKECCSHEQCAICVVWYWGGGMYILYWIYTANIKWIYISWRLSGRPLGRMVGKCKFCNTFVIYFFTIWGYMSIGYMYLCFILGSFWAFFPATQIKKLKVARDS